jgi:hypothetical protein
MAWLGEKAGRHCDRDELSDAIAKSQRAKAPGARSRSGSPISGRMPAPSCRSASVLASGYMRSPERSASLALRLAPVESRRSGILGDVQCSRGGCALQRSWPDTEQGVRVVCRRGLLGIERLAIRVRFDPDRPSQRTVLTALTGRRCQLVLEVLKPLKSGSGLNHANDLGVALHRVSLLGSGTQCCSIVHRAHRGRGWRERVLVRQADERRQAPLVGSAEQTDDDGPHRPRCGRVDRTVRRLFGLGTQRLA